MDASNIDYFRYSQAERLLILAKSQGTIRTREAIALDIHPEYLRRLVEKGILGTVLPWGDVFKPSD
jgi:O-antigen ligase